VAAVAILQAGMLAADEVDDALNLEDEIQRELRRADSLERNTKLVRLKKTSMPASAEDQEKKVTPLVEKLQKKELELVRTKEELDRMKALMRRMLATKEREKERPVQHATRAAVHTARGRHEDAERAYRRALKANPDDYMIHYNLGILYEDELKNNRKARHHYEKFLELAPDGPMAAEVREWLLSLP
jgi:tetratricopeptide (TPR) repeat protein